MFKNRPVVILDIGDNAISGALIQPPTNKKPPIKSLILFSTSQELPWQDEINLSRFLNDTTANIKQVLADLLKAGASHKVARPLEMICFLSAPYYASQSRVIKHTAAESFSVTPELAEQLVQTDLKLFAKNYPSLHPSIIDDRQRIIESKIMQFKLNRYITHQPFGQLSSELEIHNYVSLSSEKILKRLEEVIASVLHSRIVVKFHSFPFVLYHRFQEPLALITHLGAEVTEILLVHDGVLADVVSFPVGSNFLIRQLTQGLGISAAEASTALKLYTQNGRHPTTAQSFTTVLEKIKVDWLKQFSEALGTFLEHHLIPTNLLLVGNSNIVPIFSNWVTAGVFNDLVLGGGKFTVQTIKQDSLAVEKDFYDTILNYGRN